MRNILFLFLFLFIIGCNSKKNDTNNLQKYFTDLKEDEYWGIYSAYGNFKFTGQYTKFFSNGTYKDYGWDRYGKKYQADTLEIKKWKITEDSIFYYNYRFKYKVVLINEGAILVSAGNKEVSFMFIKENEKNLRKLDWKLHTDSLKLNNPDEDWYNEMKIDQ